jgi:hypothetical protein
MLLGRKHTICCFVLVLMAALPMLVFAQKKNERTPQFLKEGDSGYDLVIKTINNLHNDSCMYYAELLRQEADVSGSSLAKLY